MRILLINPPIRSVVNERGVGHQMPLGLLMIGGPLLDAGFEVRLLDAAQRGWSPTRVARWARDWSPDVVMAAHVGATMAHPSTLATFAAIKAALPETVTVYGGVHASYHHAAILRGQPPVDVVVRGEGEETVLELARALASGSSLADVRGIAWRGPDGRPVMNGARPPIADLDAWRIGWELIDDWDAYRAFGLGRAAVVQFSRGCPHTCTYCGQWMFWKRWRHRSVERFVDELAWLRREHDVRFFWLADENPTTIKETWAACLAEIGRRNLGTGMCASIRAQDIVRDADILELYARAGFLYVLMGIETVTDATLDAIRKGSSVDDGHRAVRLLREHGILSIVDYIFGLEEESLGSVWRGYRGLRRYDGDFVNALFITPHAWTPLGRSLAGAPKVETDVSRWDYRHQVLATRRLSRAQLFWLVKAVEVAYHGRPGAVRRLLGHRDPAVRRLLRHSFVHTTEVYWAEIAEFVADALRGRRGAAA
jgi:anaerobic magnesium-protoporphyrin IX monomethyl ester cyclase